MKSTNRNRHQFPIGALSAAFLLTLATSVSAAPGNLSNIPLFTNGSAEPNIMFVLDSSASMRQAMFPPNGYDAEDGENRCTSGITKPNNVNNWEVNYRVDVENGNVEFKAWNSDDWRTWDSSTNCFDEDGNYRAWVYAKDESNGYFVTGNNESYGEYRKNSVSGHFLNWFFSQPNDAGGYERTAFRSGENTIRSKVDIRRTDIMKTAASDLISELEDVRVGLMQFDASGDAHGAQMVSGLTSINSNSRAAIISAISNIGASGSTPLGESFEDVGRYFISGYDEETLEFTENGTTDDVAGNEIFESSPIWGDVAQPDDTVEGGAIQYYCQKSFMVALTDGDPTSDDGVSDRLDDYDSPSCQGVEGCTTGGNESMDDVVKALYDLDLRPDLLDENQDPVKHNITSYMIGFANNNLNNSDELINAGYFGAGYHVGDSACSGGDCSYVYSANDATELKVTFNQIINRVRAISGSSSSVAFNSTSLEANSTVYAASFDSGDWSGKLLAIPLAQDGSISENSTWEASALLDAESTDIDQRTILSYVPGVGGVAFTTTGLNFDNSDGSTEADLNINTSSGLSVADERAADRVAYLRGDRSKEGLSLNQFRRRGSRLGDIVNSTPVYIGAPEAKWDQASFPEASSYAAFRAGKQNRTPMVYVGANDGFLHGFNADTDSLSPDKGKELIAYAPAVLAKTEQDEGLHALSSQLYRHKYYVDGTPTIGDAYFENGGGWKTVLIGGLGGGGKGYFALDITNPASFSAANAGSIVLWEFTDTSNNNLGYTFSRPQIGRMANGKWAAIFGNGYNSSTGDAGLFIVYLDNSGYKYLTTSVGSTNDLNGLSTPAIVDANLDGTIDHIYAGDLRGNMWAFNVENTDPEMWGVVTTTSGEGDAAITEATPLISLPGQPITGAPLVSRNVAYEGGAQPNLLVTFGTGQYLTETDTEVQSAGGFYAVSDNGTYGLTASNLVSRTIGTEDLDDSDEVINLNRTSTGDPLDWSQYAGWYMRLNTGNGVDGGERVITRPSLLRNVLFFNTVIPTGQVCAADGEGWLMSVDVGTGMAPTDEAVYDANLDGTINSSDIGYVGQKVTAIPNAPAFLGGKRQYTSTSDGDILERDINIGGGEREGRLSWEEMTPN
ncbi:PilC/PilY family type IV pilus protein [Microbulbifer aggregans]|uniref:PilC/PilY family type IV pilus protein n=1 Tax=Microbulbifer aggregans TaxID=1769779 RepID=UPI001CFDEA85|nr:PilC/PilY family type IV pilus protein [Microbulbifer aggregans]